MRFVFLLRHYNDVDHVVPIVWKCLTRGHRTTVVMGNPTFDIETDPRLSFVAADARCEICYIHEFLSMAWASELFRIDAAGVRDFAIDGLRFVLRASGYSVRRSQRALQGADVCAFEWGEPRARPRSEVYQAATADDIPTVAFPHGLNIYLNTDVNEFRTRAIEQGAIDRSTRNAFDRYVFQSEYHREQELGFGMDPEVCIAMGSTRYCPEWVEINRGFYDPFEAEGDVDDRLKVVFMLPHWEYNVDRETTLELIEALAVDDDVYLVAKDHTRGNGSLSANQKDRLGAEPGFEAVVDPPSTALIDWSDAVINFGSSIGIEALALDRALVNPSYLHTNDTIFEATDACLETRSNDDTIERLHELHERNRPDVPSEGVEALYREVVYGGDDPHDVLGRHVDLLERLARSTE